ncbi:Integrator complex subunit 7 [Manis javanica]|nr:Integrator complex subunit 7 [Manis javanica]
MQGGAHNNKGNALLDFKITEGTQPQEARVSFLLLSGILSAQGNNSSPMKVEFFLGKKGINAGVSGIQPIAVEGALGQESAGCPGSAVGCDGLQSSDYTSCSSSVTEDFRYPNAGTAAGLMGYVSFLMSSSKGRMTPPPEVPPTICEEAGIGLNFCLLNAPYLMSSDVAKRPQVPVEVPDRRLT